MLKNANNTLYVLSPFVVVNELKSCLPIFDEKYSSTYVIDNKYSWIINNLSANRLSLTELFELQPSNDFNVDELRSAIEELVLSKIVVKIS